jgi:hypothetical protein
MKGIICSHFFDDVKDSDDTVTASYGEHVSAVTPVNCEATSAQIFNLGAGFKLHVSIEHLDLVYTTTASNNDVSVILFEL